MSLPSPGQAPASVQAEKEARRQLADSAELATMDLPTQPSPSNAPTPAIPSVPEPAGIVDPTALLRAYFEQQSPQVVTIETEAFSVDLPVVLFNANQHAVAFFIARDHVSFEPKYESQLELKLSGKTYQVIYAGGAFKFPELPYRMLSFLRVTDGDEEPES